MKFGAILASLVMFTTAANADFFRWSAETEDDPFSGGKKVTVSFMSTMRSGVLIFCDTAETGLEVRAIPGFDYVSELDDVTPEASFAIDGKLIMSASGATGQVGNSLAAVRIRLDKEQAKKFTEAFMQAKRQVAVKDGISDKPHLLTAQGSTNAGKTLLACVEKQG